MPSPRDLPNPGIKPGFPALQANSLPTELPGSHSNTFLQLQGYSNHWILAIVRMCVCVCVCVCARHAC